MFCSTRKRFSESQANIKLNGSVIKQVHFAKFLGIYIDQHLTWDKHIQQVASKLSKNVGILSKLKFLVPQKTILMVYSSLVLPYLSYCNLVWCCVSNNKLLPVFILQKEHYEIFLKLIIVLILVPCLNNLAY